MDMMGIAGASVNMSQARVLDEIGTAVLAKSLDMAETLGAGMVDMMERSMMEQSVNPSLGANIDILI